MVFVLVIKLGWAGLDWTGLGGASLVFVRRCEASGISALVRIASRGSWDQAELGRGRGETLRWRLHRVGKNDAGGRERRARQGRNGWQREEEELEQKGDVVVGSTH